MNAGRAPLALSIVLVALVAPDRGDAQPGIPPVVVREGDPALETLGDRLLLRGQPFSGYVEERAGTRLLSRVPYREGRAHGRAVSFHPNGTLRAERFYRNGNKEGTHRGYWENGQIQFIYRYKRDLFDGEQVGFYRTGARAELRQYKNGYEDGRQSTWDAEGRLESNYVFRNGRRYGIVGRFDCVSVHDR